jgi:hypothetical protein
MIPSPIRFVIRLARGKFSEILGCFFQLTEVTS